MLSRIMFIISLLFMFNTTTFAASVPFSVKIKPVPSDPMLYNISAERTYYNPGEAVEFLAVTDPFIKLFKAGEKITITFRLEIAGTVISEQSLEEVYDGVSNWTGFFSQECTLPIELTGTGKLTSTISSDSFNARTYTSVYIINSPINDLPVRYLSDFSQRYNAWRENALGNCSDGTTIGSDGCATTSKSYMFRYFAPPVQQPTTPPWLNPSELNNCLRDNGGYDLFQGCYCGIPRDSRNLICAPSDLIWEGFYCDPKVEKKNCNGPSAVSKEDLYAKIESFVSSGFPVLAKTTIPGGTHFVVIIGKRGPNEWDVYDPWDGQLHMIEHTPLGVKNINAIYLFSQW